MAFDPVLPALIHSHHLATKDAYNETTLPPDTALLIGRLETALLSLGHSQICRFPTLRILAALVDQKASLLPYTGAWYQGLFVCYSKLAQLDKPALLHLFAELDPSHRNDIILKIADRVEKHSPTSRPKKLCSKKSLIS